MRRILKKRLAIVLAALLMLPGMPEPVYAASIAEESNASAEPTGADGATSGSCGERLTWNLNADGVLTVRGTGDMADYAFGEAPWTDQVGAVQSLVIEEGITSIGNYAFLNCASLTDVSLPETLREIGDFAFCYCRGLDGIVLPEGPVSLGDGVFFGCSSLSSFRLPENMDCIPDELFCNCKSLTQMELPDTVTAIGKSAFSNCKNLQTVWIPDSVTSFGKSAFGGCTSLLEINIPEGVETIEESVFLNCASITDCTLPSTLKAIDAMGFYGCSGITEITLPKGLETIGVSAFSRSGLVSVSIPDSVAELGDNAFYWCENLSDVQFGAGLQKIGKGAFFSCNALVRITLPDALVEIDNQAFYRCSALEQAAFGTNVASIGASAFESCKKLSEAVLPDSVTEIRTKAFYGCDGLKSVTVPYTVTKIGTDAFGACDALTITGYAKSAAEQYAADADLPFHSLGDAPVEWEGPSEEDMPQPTQGPDEPMHTLNTNEGRQDMSRRRMAEIVNSYLADNGDGTLTRVEYDAVWTGLWEGDVLQNESQGISVETYDESFRFLSRKMVPMELSIFGGFYAGSDYNFMVFGQENPREEDDVEVIRVVRYSKDWVRLDSVGLYGANTTIPFDAGSLRMAQSGDVLYLHTSHKMYAFIEGVNHQANLNFSVHIPTMTQYGADYGISMYESYVSHSFNQFVALDGDGVPFYLDHGDAYPRAVVVGGSASLLDIQGTVGDNTTGVSVGGFECSDSCYLAVGTSVDQSSASAYRAALEAEEMNIFVSARNRSSGETNVRWMTDYKKEDAVRVSTPQFVKFSQDRFLILWTEKAIGASSSDSATLYYAFLDGEGRVSGSVFSQEAGALSDCRPILYQGKATWYVTSERGISYYTIDAQGAYEEHVSYELQAPDLTAECVADGIALRWNTVPKALSYTLFWRKAGTEEGYAYKTIYADDEDATFEEGMASYVLSETYQSGWHVETRFEEGEAYEFYVSARNRTLVGRKSEVLCVTYAPPSLEKPVLSYEEEAGIRFYWDAVLHAQSYSLCWRKEGENGYARKSFLDGETEFRFIDTGIMEEGSAYIFWLTASSGENGAYKGSASDEIRLIYTKPFLEKPVLSQERGLEGIWIYWNAVPHAAQYCLYWKKEGEEKSAYKILQNGETACLLDDWRLEEGSAYIFWLTASSGANGAYKGSASDEIRLIYTKPSLEKPVLSQEQGLEGIWIYWNAVPHAAQYRLYWKEEGEEKSAYKTLRNGETACLFENWRLEEGRAYLFWLSASSGTNGAYKSAESDPIRVVYVSKSGAETNRAAQRITVKKSAWTYRARKLKKKARSFAIGAKTTGDGALAYRVIKGGRYLSVTKKGRVTIKKNAPKGVYQIRITAEETRRYRKAERTIRIRIRK